MFSVFSKLLWLFLLSLLPFMSMATGEFTIANTQIHALTSQFNKQTYELYVRLPKGYKESKKAYPLIVINDTSYSIAAASGLLHLMEGRDTEKAILVGVSYSKGTNPLVSRTRDYTPTFAPNEKGGHSKEAQKVSGQADKYIQFLDEQVLPYMSANFRVNKQKTVFVGHSYGGLLGSYILLRQPTLFTDYILGSPSYWYDNDVMYKLEAEYAKKYTEMPANVYLFVGGKEKWMIDDMHRYAKALNSRNYSGLTVHQQVIADLSHYNVFSSILAYGLQKALPRKK